MDKRNKKKRKPFAGFWLIATGCVFLFGASYFVFKDTPHNTNTVQDTVVTTRTKQKTESNFHRIIPSKKQSNHTQKINQPNTKNQISTAITPSPTRPAQHTPKTIVINRSAIHQSVHAPAPSAINTPKNNSLFAVSLPLPTLLPTALLASQPKITVPNNDCYAFTGRNRNGNSTLFVDALGSPDYVKRNITAKSAEFATYKKNRIETENYEFSYSAQLGIGLETGAGIVIRSGLNYSQYESRFRKSDPDFKKVTIEQIFDNNGNHIRSDTITTYGTLDIQHYNTHKYMGIPLTLGYTTSGRKLDIGIHIGAQFNIQTTSTGRFLAANLQTTDFANAVNENKSAYKTKLGIQGIANVTLAYELGDHFDIILAPHVKFSPKTITQTDYSLDEKLTTTGLWIGGRIRF